MICAAILAGGIGSRLKQGKPKQFVNINNKPIKWFSKDDIEITPLTPNSNSSQTVYGKIQS